MWYVMCYESKADGMATGDIIILTAYSVQMSWFPLLLDACLSDEGRGTDKRERLVLF